MTKRNREPIDNMSSDDIRSIVLEISCAAGNPKDKQQTFQKRHPEFAERYPALFEMACHPNFDMSKLQYMLNLRDQITQKERTVEDASKEVGQTLFNEYVHPIVSNMPPTKH